MGRGKLLNENEKGKSLGFSKKWNEWKANRSQNQEVKNCDSSFSCKSMQIGTINEGGRLWKWSARMKRTIIRMAVKDNAHSTAIKTAVKLQVTARTVRNTLNYAENFNYSILKRKPQLWKTEIRNI